MSTVAGTSGDDILVATADDDQFEGYDGFDFVSYANATSGVLAILASPWSNTGWASGDTYVSIEGLIGSAYADTLAGDDNANTLQGGNGDDYLQSRGGDDTLEGGDGNDRLEGGAGADTLSGGAGFDYADYGYASSMVTVDLANASNNLGEALGDTFDSIEGVIGSQFSDFLYGDDNANDLAGLDGDDWLQGRGGDDNLQGMNGNDTLDGGAGADALNGGAGFDYASYASAGAGVLANMADPSQNAGDAAGDFYISIEGLIGSSFDDTLAGDSNANTLRGGDGSDYLQGREGADTLKGENGTDFLEGNAGSDILDGGLGLDYATYRYAASGVKVDLANTAVNTGEAAGDTFLSIEGIVGSQFKDFLYGDGNANDLAGLDGDDTIDGRGGNDSLQGMNGNDTLIGGAGIDMLNGGAGADKLDGGDGFDYAVYATATSGVRANLKSASQNTGEAAGDSYKSIEGLVGSNYADTLVGDGQNNELVGLDGNDVLDGDGGDDNLQGGGGNDTLDGGSGVDTLDGGAGADRLKGGSGNDIFVFRIGEANGDTLVDFDGHGASLRDQMVFQGYGTAAQGATFTFIGADTSGTHWSINSYDGSVHDAITLLNSATVHATDYSFI